MSTTTKQKTLTQKQIDKYLNHPYHCPVCNADDDNINWGTLDPGEEITTRNCQCRKCDAEWDEIMTITGVELTENL